MHLVRLFFILMATRVVLEKVSEDYQWFLRYLQRHDPEWLERIPGGNKIKKAFFFFDVIFIF